jgi:hypothetical protein
MRPLIILDGRIAKKFTPGETKDGKPMLRFTVTHSEKAEDGSWIPTYYNIAVFGAVAEGLKPRLEAGANYAFLRGELSVSTYINKENKEITQLSVLSNYVRVFTEERRDPDEQPPQPSRFGNKLGYRK